MKTLIGKRQMLLFLPLARQGLPQQLAHVFFRHVRLARSPGQVDQQGEHLGVAGPGADFGFGQRQGGGHLVA